MNSNCIVCSSFCKYTLEHIEFICKNLDGTSNKKHKRMLLIRHGHVYSSVNK